MSASVASRIVWQLLHVTVLNGAGFVLRFLLFWCLGRNFVPDEFGAYAAIGSVISLGLYALGLDLYTYMTRHAPGRSMTEGLTILRTFLTFELALSVGVMGLLIGTGMDRGLLGVFGLGSYVWAFRLAALLLLFELAATEIARYHTALKGIEVGNVMQFIVGAGWIVPLLAVWAGGARLTLTHVLVAWIAGSIVALGYGLWRIGPAAMAPISIDWRLLRPAMVFGAPMLLAEVGSRVIFVADRWLLAFFDKLDAVGRYAYAFNLMSVLYALVASGVVAVVLPYAVEAANHGDRERCNRLLVDMLKYATAMLGLGVAVLAVHGVEIVRWMARPEYWGVGELLPWLAPVPFLMAIVAPPHYLLFIRSRTRWICASYTLGTAVALGLNVVLIPSFGAVGAAIATDLGLATITASIYWGARAESAPSWRSSGVMEILLTTAIVWIGGAALEQWGQNQFGIMWTVWVLVMTATYVLCLVLLGVLGNHELNMLRASLAPRSVRL